MALNDLPVGTVTFLFTDIEGSTQLLKQLGDAYAELIHESRKIHRETLARWDGKEVDTQGDSFFASFPRAKEAVAAAIGIQRGFMDNAWPRGVEVHLRMGLHTGEPIQAGEGYVGIDVHRAARIGNVGYGGQILLSETTALLVQDELMEGSSLLDLQRHQLKDVERPIKIYQLVADGLRADFPALRTIESVPQIVRRWRESRALIWRCVRRCGIAGGLVMMITSLLSILQIGVALPAQYQSVVEAIPLPIWAFTNTLLGILWGGMQGIGAAFLYGLIDAFELEKPRWVQRAFLGGGAGLIHTAFILFTASTSGSWTNAGPGTYIPVYLLYGYALGASFSFVIPHPQFNLPFSSKPFAILLAFLTAGVIGLLSVSLAYQLDFRSIYYQLDVMMFLITALLYPIGFTFAYRSMRSN